MAMMDAADAAMPTTLTVTLCGCSRSEFVDREAFEKITARAVDRDCDVFGADRAQRGGSRAWR